MTRQRQILVTVTYNELGCIIDTKAEPYEEQNLQPTCNQLATSCISRQAAIDALGHMMDTDGFRDGWAVSRANVDCMLRALPSVQPELQWHKCDPDDPSSFPDDDRPVLVSFPDSTIPAVGWFERNYDFCGWTDGELFGLHADGWWELPKKPERRTDEPDK